MQGGGKGLRRGKEKKKLGEINGGTCVNKSAETSSVYRKTNNQTGELGRVAGSGGDRQGGERG